MLSIGKISAVTLLLCLAALMLGGCGGSDSLPAAPAPAPQAPSGPVSVNLWTWVSGSKTGNQGTTYGVSTNTVGTLGGREAGVSWTDSAGNFWFFGGDGYDSSANYGVFNDLWKFNGTNWIWFAGSNATNQPGTYTSIGSTGTPGARVQAVSWIDTAGNLWLFGGSGNDGVGGGGLLNDLWKFSGGSWTWMAGSNASGKSGTYSGASPVPGGRCNSATWTDSAGHLWLFGGFGLDSTTNSGYLNDLWEFDGTYWTWVSGSNARNQAGIYTSIGSTGTPGGRQAPSFWIDSSGDLWLFGGYGYDCNDSFSRLNDLWKFDTTAKTWTWVSGSSAGNQWGTYGASTGTTGTPGGRWAAVSWTDSNNNLWLFGGQGYDSVGAFNVLNDLWKFDGTTWTWVSGSKTAAQSGTFGAATGTTGMPGARQNSVSWIDSSGDLWLFGGYGRDSAGTGSFLNDLWKYQP